MYEGQVQGRTAEDERQSHGVHEGKQGEPIGGVLADVVADSGFHWLLSDVAQCN